MIKLPIPDQALATSGAILGNPGAGKSGTGRGILEHELDAGHRCCAIDPKGDWWGIRAYKDGKPSRFQIVIFGGEHADIPITDEMGAQLGEIVATSTTSCVIDLSSFSRKGMLRFMRGFAEALFTHNREALTLLVDEADQLAPQRVSNDMAMLLHHMEALVRQGRNRGIFMWMLTQRPAVINKNVLGMAQSLIAMRMLLPHDRKAIRDWMDGKDPEQAAIVEQDLAQLSVGQAWAWVPEADFLEKVQFPLYDSYDSGRTPKHGERVGKIDLKPLDVAGLAALLAGEADEKVDELAAARAENARLTERNAVLTRRTTTAEAQRDAAIETLTTVQDAIGMAIGSPRIEALPPGAERDGYLMVLEQDGVVRPLNARMVTAARMRAGVRQMRSATMPKVPETPTAAGVAVLSFFDGPKVREVMVGLPPAMRRIVAAIAAGGGAPVPADQVAAAAGVSPTSSNMGVALRRVAEHGIIAQDGDAWKAVIA